MKIKVILWFVLGFFNLSGAFRQLNNSTNGPCLEDQFRCLNNECIARHQFCNGQRDCTDNSDEKYCRNTYNCPTTYPFYRCNDGNKCIPSTWKCDGVGDCRNGDDETNCDTSGPLNRLTVFTAKLNATKWLYNQLKNESSGTDRWGIHLRKIAVALYLGDSAFQAPNETRTEMAYELSVQLLSKFAFRKLKEVSTFDLASFTNALLVTCLDPRKFHSANLVEEMRSRVDTENYTNPYVFLTLCNAGEKIKEEDIQKLNQTFWKPRVEFWTGTQAIVVMALACAANQPNSNFDMKRIKDLTLELKKRQYRNGTVEDLKTTALVMQALMASEPEDPDNFDEDKAVLQLLNGQKKDGSFDNVVNTYYVLPVLAFKTLANISSNHCKPYKRDEESSLEDLMNNAGPKIRIRYSLWIGKDRDVEWTLKLRVPANISFYGIMEIAGDIDSKFRFQYVMRNSKPYANVISGKQDDPESGRFWFMYSFQESKPVPVLKSPADVLPKDNDHIVMWYRSGAWIQ